ncbi:MAG: Uma2 family endonuclease [Deltaproteobacteria bacterium]
MSTATRITVANYDRMIAEGVFDGRVSRPRIELIDGELREMSPIGSQHELAIAILTEWSVQKLPAGKAWAWVQCSIAIPERDSAPQPDLAWVARKDYSPSHPTHPDVFLIIEVADSTVIYDCGEKANLYASAGIADYWVVNIPGRSVEVFRQPENGRFRSRQTFQAPAEIRPLAFPQVALPVEKLFPAQAGA